MNKIGLIIKREYLHKVSKRSFIIVTMLMPILVAAAIAIPAMLATIDSDETKQIAVIDRTGRYSDLFEDTEAYSFVNLQDDESIARYRIGEARDLYAYLMIEGDLTENPSQAAIYSDKQIPIPLKLYIEQILSEQVRAEKLSKYEVQHLDNLLRDSRLRIEVATRKWSADGQEQETSATSAVAIGIILTTLIYITILIYGGMVMQSVMEEKTNRIVEIIISSVKPFELMMGKIIATGLVAITQLFLWGVMLTFLVLAAIPFLIEASAMPPSMLSVMPDTSAMLSGIDFSTIAPAFIAYFIGGYLIFAAIFAAIGGSLNQQEDAQQFVGPISIILVLAFYIGMHSSNNPDAPLAFWGSMFPLTSPVVMMVRLPYDVPKWELLLSLTILYTSAIGFVAVAARIYRVGILMYGKKPTISEMIKWIRK